MSRPRQSPGGKRRGAKPSSSDAVAVPPVDYLTIEAFDFKALEHTYGLPNKLADRLKVSRACIIRSIERCPQVAELVNDLKQAKIDDIEDTMLLHASSGSVKAAQLVLRAKARDRGYSDGAMVHIDNRSVNGVGAGSGAGGQVSGTSSCREYRPPRPAISRRLRRSGYRSLPPGVDARSDHGSEPEATGASLMPGEEPLPDV